MKNISTASVLKVVLKTITWGMGLTIAGCICYIAYIGIKVVYDTCFGLL